MKRRILWPAGFSTALLACGGSSGGGGDPPDPPGPPTCSAGIETPRAFTSLDFSSPVAMVQPPIDASRWYVVEQGGQVFVFDNDPAVPVATEVLDLRDRVHREGEAGLLGMAFHPDFATNGLVYLNFSELVGARLSSVTAEFSSPDGGQTLDPASERVLLTVDKPAANHNGGNIAFGPDGFLYIGLGDGGGSGDPGGQRAESADACSARCCASTWTAGRAAPPTAYRAVLPAIRSPATRSATWTAPGRRHARRSTPSVSGIPGAGVSTASSATCGSATSARPPGRKSTSSTRGGNYGWNSREGAHCFEPDDRMRDAGSHRSRRGIRARPRILDHGWIRVSRPADDAGCGQLRVRRLRRHDRLARAGRRGRVHGRRSWSSRTARRRARRARCRSRRLPQDLDGELYAPRLPLRADTAAAVHPVAGLRQRRAPSSGPRRTARAGSRRTAASRAGTRRGRNCAASSRAATGAAARLRRRPCRT